MRLASYISLLWAGLLVGSSFLATPAKFLAPSLTMAQALEVGRVTFDVLSWVESAFLFVLSLALLRIVFRPFLMLVFTSIIALLLIQQVFLLPALSARTDLVIHGLQPGPSNLHLFYIAAEFLKVCALVYLASLVQKTMADKELPGKVSDKISNATNFTNRYKL